MDSNELKKQLRKLGPEEFVKTRFFDDYAWFCPTQSGDEYGDFRADLGGVFKIAANDIAIVGSGKYGFSLAPDKDFRAFQPRQHEPDPSDLDLAIISRALFNSTWHHLRRADYNGAVNARKFYQEDVFRRFVMIGTDDAFETKFLRDLSGLLNAVRKKATTRFGIDQTIKMRVYCSWTDAKAYHIWSMQRLGEANGIQ